MLGICALLPSNSRYVRFKYAEAGDMAYLRQVALKVIADKYSIDMSRLGTFFEDTLGLAVER